MFEVLSLDDGQPKLGHYIKDPNGELCTVYDNYRDAEIHVAILNFALKVEAIEE
tara:strand:- start:240 stop:401 length:162 start_codon:yes stop_codon:yes gene_type:complete